MGNCSRKPKIRLPVQQSKQSPIISLYGSESCPVAALIRIALLYKNSAFHFIPSESQTLCRPVLRRGSEAISGSADLILRYIDSRFQGPPSVAPAVEGNGRRIGAVELRVLATLQHRSMERHLEGVARWAAELVVCGGGGRKAGKRYSELVEVMLDHAQMEERFLFPLLERAAEDRVLCAMAYEEHARALPMMNGIKEDIKSIMAMDSKAPCYREAVLNLSQRLKKLQEHCKRHYQTEERELLPLLEAAEWTAREEGEEPQKWLEQVMGMMEATHSRLFPFFIAGLLPHEAMRYVHLVFKSIKDQQQLGLLLRSLVASLEATRSLPAVYSNHFKTP